MAPKIGYLLPTRERVMEGRPDGGALLDLAQRAEDRGYDSVWIGDSLFDKPRHEPLTMLAGIAGRTKRVALGTAVLLPALRNPVLLAQQAATVDQLSAGRLILGLGIGSGDPGAQAEFVAAGVPFEKRVGRLLESLKLCRALWSGEPVDWDGRWQLKGVTLGPEPCRPGGPPLWMGGCSIGSMQRAARYFDGWFPDPREAETYGEGWAKVQDMAATSGRDPSSITAAMYLTLRIDDEVAVADAHMAAFFDSYYPGRGAQMKQNKPWFAGSAAGAADYLSAFAEAGVGHFVLRFTGDHDAQLEAVAAIRAELGW
jgi:probable F420-dependent oxidoreductase